MLKKITSSNYNKFDQELSNVIDKIIAEYKTRFPVFEVTKTSFYDSEVVIRQLMEFRFTKKLDVVTFEQSILSDEWIIPSTQEQLIAFLEIFDGYVGESVLLKDHYVDLNYKEIIFSTFEAMQSMAGDLQNSVKEIKEAISGSTAVFSMRNEKSLKK